MLFTVVESRDARLVAETADRRLKMTIEGEGAGEFALESKFTLLPHSRRMAPVVTHDLSVGEVMSLSTVEAGLRSEDSEPMPEVRVEVVRSDGDEITVGLAEPLAAPAVEE